MSESQKPPVDAGTPAAPKPPSRQGGWLFPAIVILVIAAWCVKDGFITPDPEGKNVLFNQVMGVILGLGGLALLVYELLLPRTTPPPGEPEKKGPESGS